MKESMSVTYIFQFVILFILLFTAIMALTINHSNAFGVKDRIVSLLEENGGDYLNGDVLNQDIVDLIESTSYRTTGKCPSDYQGFDRSGAMITNNNAASICIKKIDVSSGIDRYLKEIYGDDVAIGESLPGFYLQVVVFYQLDLPIVSQVYNVSSKAETKLIFSR